MEVVVVVAVMVVGVVVVVVGVALMVAVGGDCERCATTGGGVRANSEHRFMSIISLLLVFSVTVSRRRSRAKTRLVHNHDKVAHKRSVAVRHRAMDHEGVRKHYRSSRLRQLLAATETDVARVSF